MQTRTHNDKDTSRAGGLNRAPYCSMACCDWLEPHDVMSIFRTDDVMSIFKTDDSRGQSTDPLFRLLLSRADQ